MGIVEEIIVAVKAVLDADLTGYKRLNNEYNLDKNNERGITKRFGFTPGSATFVEGGRLGSTTMDHIFSLKLVNDYQAKDDDESLRTALFSMYEVAQNTLKNLQKSRLALPTPAHKVLLISGLTFDDPEIIEDNSTINLIFNLNIQYSFKNN